MVHEREDITGLDASIIMHPKVWEASGHLAGFSDPLVDCLISKERFRADKAPTPNIGDEIHIKCNDKGQAKDYQSAIEKRFDITLQRNGKVLEGLKVVDKNKIGFFENNSDQVTKTFDFPGYVSPTFNSPFLSEEKQFNLMFRSQIGAVDSLGDIFDPHIHDAMMVQESKKKKNLIIEEFEKGYRYNDKIIRHSKVIVSKGK